MIPIGDESHHIFNKAFQEEQYMSQLYGIPSYLKHLERGKMYILELRKIW